MQRANGDWFALNQREGLRVPIFSSNREAMRARAFNVEMLVFKPVLLTAAGVKTLAPTNGDKVDFWLVEKESTNMKRGQLLNHSQLASLVSNSNE